MEFLILSEYETMVMKNKADQTSGETERHPALVQMPMRCSPDLQERIIRALGESMSRSGKKISKNDFLVHLIELGLHQVEGSK